MSRYRTEQPNRMRHTAGWGRVNGPLGNAITETIRKKNTMHIRPDQILSSRFASFLEV